MVQIETFLHQQGLEQGLEQGVEQGQRALLMRQLERRFGSLPAAARRRLAAVESDDLERWGERILDAATLDDVFAGS